MAGVWTRISASPRSMRAVQALTEATAGETEGVYLEAVDCIVPVLHAPGGQTFAGQGRLVGYAWDGALWVRSPNSDIDMASAAGLTDWSPGGLIVDSSRGKFQLVPTGVTLSGAGTTITTDYLCTTKASAGVPA